MFIKVKRLFSLWTLVMFACTEASALKMPEELYSEYGCTASVVDENAYFTKDLGNLFGGKHPSVETVNGGNQWFYVYNEPPKESKPYRIDFPCAAYNGSAYMMDMNLYVMKTKSEPNKVLKIKSVDPSGMKSEQTCYALVVNDETGATSDTFKCDDSKTINIDLDKIDITNKLLHIKVVCYGLFPSDKYDYRTETYNGMKNYTVLPLLQNFDDFSAVAIHFNLPPNTEVVSEYVNECAGKKAYLEYPGRNHYYSWEELVAKDWEPLVIDGVEQTKNEENHVSVDVKEGIHYYRCLNEYSSFYDGFYYIKVIGKHCENADVPIAKTRNWTSEPVNVYDVNGHLVRERVEPAHCLDGLKNGIYFVNGEKFVVQDNP